jgi:hypothetical protein
MNEMKLLEDFCASVARPAAQWQNRTRARLLAAAAAPPGLIARGPGRATALAKAVTRLRHAVACHRRAVFTAAAAATAAAVVFGAGIPFGGRSLAPPASAAELLQRAATAALTGPVAHAGQYIYTEAVGAKPQPSPAPPKITKPNVKPTVTQSPAKPEPIVKETEQMWSSVDGSKPGVLDMTAPCGPLWAGGAPPRPTYGACHAAIEPLGLPDSSYASPYAGLGTYAALEKLPANPAALLDYIQKYYATSYAQQIAAQQAAGGPVTVGSVAAWDFDWMRYTLDFVAVLPPPLGAAIFQALARIPGVYLIPHVTDYAGRPGMAVAMTIDGQRNELIFDPGTYQYLGSQTVLTQSVPGLPAGTVVQAIALLKTAVVNTAPKPPTGTVY